MTTQAFPQPIHSAESQGFFTRQLTKVQVATQRFPTIGASDRFQHFRAASYQHDGLIVRKPLRGQPATVGAKR